MLIEDLTPKLEDVNEDATRLTWLNKVHQYRPVVEKILRLETENPVLYGTHSPQTICRAKYIQTCLRHD